MASTKSGQNAILWVIAGGAALFFYKNISLKKDATKASGSTTSSSDKITKQTASTPSQSSKGSGSGSGSGSGGSAASKDASAKVDPMGAVEKKLNDYFGDSQEAKDLTAQLKSGKDIEDAANKVGEDWKEVASALTGVDVTKDVETVTDPMGTQLIPELNGTLGTAAGPLTANETAYNNGANGIAPDSSTVGGGIGDSLASAINDIVAGVTGNPELGNTVDTLYKAPNTELIPEEVADPSMGGYDGSSENGDQSGDYNGSYDSMGDGNNEGSDDSSGDDSSGDSSSDDSSGDDSSGDDWGGDGGGGDGGGWGSEDGEY